MTKLLCFADLHLQKRASHEREPGDGLRDQAHALTIVGDTAITHRVDAVVNAGDTFEGPTITPAQVGVYGDFVARMAEYNILVYTLLGNGRHDLALREETALRVFDHVPGIETFTRPGFVRLGDTELCFMPWVHRGRVNARRDDGDRDVDEVNATVAQLQLRVARDLYASTSEFAKHRLLVLHGKLEGAATPTGLAIESLASDVLPIDEVAAIGFDAIIAGDIHIPQAFATMRGWLPVEPADVAEGAPIFYTGSPMPLDFGEGGYEHGVWIVDLDETVTAQFVPVEGTRRFVTVDVDLTAGHETFGLDETDAVAAAIATHLPIDEEIVRVRVRATDARQAAAVDIPALKCSVLADTHWCSITVTADHTQRARVDEIDEDIAPLDAVDLYARAHDLEDVVAAALREDTALYLERVGAAT